MCIFYHQFHTHSKWLFSVWVALAMQCYAFWTKIRAERTRSSSIDVILGSSAHKFIFDFRNFVVPFFVFFFLSSRLRAFSIPKCVRRVCPFAVIMQYKNIRSNAATSEMRSERETEGNLNKLNSNASKSHTRLCAARTILHEHTHNTHTQVAYTGLRCIQRFADSLFDCSSCRHSVQYFTENSI